MTKVRVGGFSVSLDGFGAGPEQSLQDPLGKRGEELHGWAFHTRSFKAMLGEPGGSGDDRPYHAPTFVLTHHARAPVEMAGGTTFYFVTEGIEAALEQAKAAA